MLKNGFYNTLASVIRIVVTLLTVPVIIRLLGIEQYGLFSLASTIVNSMSLAEAGLALTMTVFISRDLAVDNTNGIAQTFGTVALTMIFLAALALVAMYITAPIITNSFNLASLENQKLLVKALGFGAISVSCKLLQQIFVGFEQAYQRYDWINIVNTLQVLFTYMGMWIISLLGGSIVSLMKWQAICTFITLLAHGHLNYSTIHPLIKCYKWSNTGLKQILKFSFATWLGSLSSLMFSQFDKIIVASLFSPSLLGIYSAITSVTSQINQLSAIAVQPVLPVLSRMISLPQTSINDLEAISKKILAVNFTIALGMGGSLLSLSFIWLPIVIPGVELKEVLFGCQILVIIYSIYSVNASGYYLMIGTGSIKSCTMLQLIASTITLALIYEWGKEFGFAGSTLGNIGYVLTLGMLILGFRELNIDIWKVTRPVCPLCIWFLAVVMINLFFDIRNEILGTVFISQTLILCIILYKTKELKPIFSRLQKTFM